MTLPFTCPHCGVYAQQAWIELFFPQGQGVSRLSVGLALAQCRHCGENTVWMQDRVVYPTVSQAPRAHLDMPEGVAADFNEARDIVGRSPRGACALLRLALQKLCVELGQPGKKLDDDIAALVRERGLLPRVQQALDVLRVIGNNAVHPGELDLRDDQTTAQALFKTLNLIVEQLITSEKETRDLYAMLPEGARESIEKRDRE